MVVVSFVATVVVVVFVVVVLGFVVVVEPVDGVVVVEEVRGTGCRDVVVVVRGADECAVSVDVRVRGARTTGSGAVVRSGAGADVDGGAGATMASNTPPLNGLGAPATAPATTTAR